MKEGVSAGRKTVARLKPRAQCAALPYRRAPELEILLVTSRETGRWVIPKGWTMKTKTRREAAAVEALEEAGVEGKVAKAPLGAYDYLKILRSGESQACRVTVFPLRVAVQRETWREQNQRTTQWFDWEAAAAAVREPGLARLIRKFAHAAAIPVPADDSTTAAPEGAPEGPLPEP